MFAVSASSSRAAVAADLRGLFRDRQGGARPSATATSGFGRRCCCSCSCWCCCCCCSLFAGRAATGLGLLLRSPQPQQQPRRPTPAACPRRCRPSPSCGSRARPSRSRGTGSTPAGPGRDSPARPRRRRCERRTFLCFARGTCRGTCGNHGCVRLDPVRGQVAAVVE